MQQQEKITAKPYDKVNIQSNFDYEIALAWFEKWGKKQYGDRFEIIANDKKIILKLIAYFLKDEIMAPVWKIDLTKGILFSGPVGVGKTAIMHLVRLFQPPEDRYIIKSCRDISFEFIGNGYETIHKYSRFGTSQNKHRPKTICFDDLGCENNLKYFGNECNIMAEILLSRYELFITQNIHTHITTNLSASEIEECYGNRVRSRMREMFNLIAFEPNAPDKRK